MKKSVSLKKALLMPLFFVLAFIISFFLFLDLQMEKRFTQQYLDQEFFSAQKLLESSTQLETEKLEGFLKLLNDNSQLKQAMKNDNKQRLLSLAAPLFENLKKYHVSHFYFHQPDLVNYLRVHQPGRFGDKINRKSAVDAAKTQNIAWAVEIGPLGLFTLRVVMPWFDQGKLIGYLELGEEIEHIYEHVNQGSNIGLLISITKEVLERSAWESGNQLLKRQNDWDLLPNSIVAFSTLGTTHREFCSVLCLAGKTLRKYQHVTVHDKMYQTYSVPIESAKNASHTIGQMVFFKDITRLKTEGAEHLWTAAPSAILASILLLLFFNYLIEKIEQKIRQANRSLQESEERFRHLVESSTDWIWEVDFQGRYVYSSPKVKDILGYTPEEILGKTPFEFMPEDEAQRLKKIFADFVRENRPFTGLENINCHKNGAQVILETNGLPVFNDASQLIGYRGVDRDITQRKRQESELMEMTQKVLLHFEQTPLGAIEWNTDFQVINWNPAATKIFGYSKQEALGKTAEELVLTAKDSGHVFTVWSQLLLNQSGGLRSINENITQDGRVIMCKWYNTPLIDKQGKVIGVASFVEDITEQQKAQEQISYMAYYDELTGLANRALFEDRLKQNMLTADRNQTLLAVLFLDIDNFKKVNDTLGHQAGDMILREVALRLQKLIRAKDSVARFGGDEFTILLTDLEHEEDIQRIIDSIYIQFNEAITLNDDNFFINFSIGSVVYPQDGKTIEALFRNSDTAMYYAKEHGRNNHQRYLSKMTESVRQSFTLQTDLHDAVKKDEFELYYQPQVDTLTEKLIGVEALIRWNHPTRGIVSPGEFIPDAESSGLIIPMGRWVYQTACQQLKDWQDAGLPPMVMAINLSPIQFRQKGLIDEFIQFVQDLQLDCQWIELELTENLLIENSTTILTDLNKLRNAGFKLAIDDFGTGYSALSYLSKYPMTKLKIDQMFIRELFLDESNQTLVRAIISMSNALGLHTIAEGVETKQQLDFLRREGCQQIQGYYFAKPMPAAEISKTYAKSH